MTAPLSARVRERLRCPSCGSPLRDEASNEVSARVSGEPSNLRCVSAACGLEFGALDGIPALFDESRSIFSIGFARRAGRAATVPDSLRARIDRLLPNLDRNVSAVGNLEHLCGQLLRANPEPVLLNIGDKHPSTPSQELRRNPAIDVVELDVRPSAQTNLLADPIQLPFAAETFDGVLAIAVLEHVIDPIACVAEIHRVLKPGGLVYSDVPFLLEVHAGAFDYQRFTPVGHRNLFRDFERLDSGITQGPGVALSHAVQAFLLSFVRRDWARYAVKALSRVTLFWLRYFDSYLQRRPGANDAALGTYFMGRKDGRTRSDGEILDGYAGITPDLYPGRRSR